MMVGYICQCKLDRAISKLKHIHYKYYNKQIYITKITGELGNSNEVLGWLIHQMKTDEIEEVTDEMLKMLVDTNPHVAVIFCK